MIRHWIQSAFTEQGLTFWPMLALGLFFCIFVGAVFWIFRSGSGDFYRRQAALPLEGGTTLSGSTENIRAEVKHGDRA